MYIYAFIYIHINLYKCNKTMFTLFKINLYELFIFMKFTIKKIVLI